MLFCCDKPTLHPEITGKMAEECSKISRKSVRNQFEFTPKSLTNHAGITLNPF